MDCFLFDDLSESQKKTALLAFEPSVKIKKNGELYKKACVGILASGKAKIRRKDSSGAVTTIRSIGAGDVFGVASVFGEWQDGFSSINAESECEVFYIGEENLKALMQDIPQISLNYIFFLSDRIRFLNRRIDAFSASDTEHRLYEFLVSQCSDNDIVELEYSMAELARRLKIGRSSLYRSIDSLEKNGFITRNNQSFKIK